MATTETKDDLLQACVQDLHAARGVAVREFPLGSGYGFADYLLYVDKQAVGVVEAKKAGTTLTGVELQSEKYSAGLPAHVPAPAPRCGLWTTRARGRRVTARLPTWMN